MNDHRKCDLWDRLRAWPGEPPRQRTSGPLDVPITRRRRGARQDRPDADSNARKDAAEISVPEPVIRAFKQCDELHTLLGSLDATLQRARIRVHIVEAELAKIAEGQS